MAQRRKVWHPQASRHAGRWPGPKFSVIGVILTGWRWMPALLITGALILGLGHFMWGWFDGGADWTSGSAAMAPGWEGP